MSMGTLLDLSLESTSKFKHSFNILTKLCVLVTHRHATVN